MSGNTSASDSDFLLIHYHLPFGLNCLIGNPYSFTFSSYTCFNVLVLLPVCCLVLHLARQRSSVATSHSDSFTYHLVAMEIIYVCGSILGCLGIYLLQLEVLRVGIHAFSITWFGKVFFHMLTCVEHYLAVVHPITYRNLRTERWIRIRNIVICGIWLLCIGGSVLITLDKIAIVVMICLLISSLAVISFCCVSVLCVLIHPGPGRQGRDPTKQRAFYTILAILGVLLLRCTWSLVWAAIFVCSLNVLFNFCMLVTCELSINVVNSLLLPLLFLQKAEVLTCCKLKQQQMTKRTDVDE